MKVKCIKLLDGYGKPTDYSPWAKVGGIYPVFAVEVDHGQAWFRMLGEEQGTPVLFEPEMFEIVSPIIPPHWVIATTGSGSFDLAPEPWTHKEFWERYSNREPEAVASFERELAKTLAADP
jgi:hypothetical protein